MGHRLTEIDRLTVEIRERNTLLGWRDKGNTFGDYIALLHSEVTEAVEAYRDHKAEDATGLVGNGAVRLLPAKPEGVGSEFADVAIRLLDMCDVFGYTLRGVHSKDFRLAEVAPQTFGDWCAYLHLCISNAYMEHCIVKSEHHARRRLEMVLETMETACEVYGIDLDAEVARKMAYNATRPYRHGRGTLVTCTCESETWTPDTPRGEDGLDHHPNCPLDKPRGPTGHPFRNDGAGCCQTCEGVYDDHVVGSELG